MKRNQHGLVIIAVLWICALIMWLGLQTSANIRLRNEEEVQRMRRSRAIYCALSGVYEALAHMGENVALEDNPEASWMPDGKPRIMALDGCRVMVTVEDETTKVNVNQAGPEALRKVLERAGVDPDGSEALVDRIVDFLDPDDWPRLEGAEADSYEKQGIGYPPFNGVLQSLDQMVLIPGIDADLFWGRGDRAPVKSERSRGRDRPLAFPPRDSLFDLCTVYGNNTALAKDEDDALFDARSEFAEEPGIVPWTPGKIYRVLAAGSLDGVETGAVIWVEARYDPGTAKGFSVLYRKIL